MPIENHHKTEESKSDNFPSKTLVKARKLLHQMKNVSSGILVRLNINGKPFYRHTWFLTGVGFGLGLSSGIAGIHYGIAKIDSSLPDKSELNAILREQTLTIKASDGTVLQQQGEVTREHIKLDQIPDNLKKAFIASEDRRFEQHHGIDGQGIFRAFVNNLRSQGVVEGGSTITQQVARILFLSQEKTVWRKLKEIRLAQKMEEELSKRDILERYMNLVYLGSGAYGVGDAAWIYFSKSVDELTLSEMATIAGLAPAPNLYAPDKNLDLATERRNTVLNIMQEEGMITPEQKQQAMSEPLVVNTNLPRRLQVKYPYFTTYVQQELPKYVPADVLAAGGLVVETTLNPTWQEAAEAAVDKILENKGRWQNFKQAALVAINPKNGEVQAMVGGKDFNTNQFNRVTQAQRQPGSTFKGFVYAAAIATGKDPYDTYLDAPFIIDGYEPKNYSEKFYGSMNMREALTRSINTIAVKVLIDVGYQPTIKLAQAMGIKSELKPTYSLALGSNEVNLLELTSAYGSFATQGLHTEVHGIKRILNRQGNVIWSADFQSQRVLDADSSAIMTWMLRNVVNSGTAGAAQLNDRQVAGKTGTSDESRDLWFIGYIPQVVAGVWLGNDDNRPTWGSSTSAAYAWREFMKEAVKEMPVEKFPSLPKLSDRKGTIKAEPIKPRKIVKRSIPRYENSTNNSNDDDDNQSSRRSRSRRRSRRTYQQQEDNSTYTPRRRRSYQRQEETPTRRRRSTYQPSRRRSTPTSSPAPNTPSTPKPSWRERLKPGSSSNNE
ncbi:MAG: penicillin-binding protein 1A [Nostocales cyanobacterium]|nr:MAG: penicillin-binding protein 1A [Nostocales cyanobacterium]TAF20947.1 MAG: penicillin-binding protein 1A [Nostocales cyanobacterium]